jgi:hypothetical protein
MKQFIKWSAPVIALALTIGSVSAATITGAITFSGGVTLDTASVVTATKVTSYTNPIVQSRSGDFGGIALGTAVSIVAPWSFNTPTPGINNFWQVGGFTFNLTQSSIAFQTAGLLGVTGTGFISGNGFTATAGTWTFTGSDPGAGTPLVFSFQAANGTVPDGGTTVMLLGAALTGLGLLKRRFVA